MRPYVHGSIIDQSQNMKATCMITNRCLDNDDSAHIRNGILLSHEKE